MLAAVGRLNADLGTTVLLAEHRLERAAPLADRAVVLESGSIVEAPGPTAPGARRLRREHLPSPTSPASSDGSHCR